MANHEIQIQPERANEGRVESHTAALQAEAHSHSERQAISSPGHNTASSHLPELSLHGSKDGEPSIADRKDGSTFHNADVVSKARHSNFQADKEGKTFSSKK